MLSGMVNFTRKKNAGRDTLSTTLLSADTGKERKCKEKKVRKNGTALL